MHASNCGRKVGGQATSGYDELQIGFYISRSVIDGEEARGRHLRKAHKMARGVQNPRPLN